LVKGLIAGWQGLTSVKDLVSQGCGEIDVSYQDEPGSGTPNDDVKTSSEDEEY